MSTRKSILLLALAMAVLGIAAFALMAVKDRTYVPSETYAPVGEPNRAVAVVYYSRSGHSEAVAREVARTFNAPIARISADYPLDFSGQGKAVSDANAGELPTGNSRFEQTEIDAFARRVEARGGRLFHHLFLRRGRIYWQKSREDLLAEARARIRDYR